MTDLDLDNLPPDTFVIYPDRLGNYHFEMMPDSRPDANAMPATHQTGEEPRPLFSQPARVGPNLAGAEFPEAEQISALDRNWISLRPVLGYGVAGFAVCLLMFISAAQKGSRPANALPQPHTVTSVAASPEQSAALTKPRDLHRAMRESRYEDGPEVIIHHYDQRAHALPVETKIRKYSDWK